MVQSDLIPTPALLTSSVPVTYTPIFLHPGLGARSGGQGLGPSLRCTPQAPAREAGLCSAKPRPAGAAGALRGGLPSLWVASDLKGSPSGCETSPPAARAPGAPTAACGCARGLGIRSGLELQGQCAAEGGAACRPSVDGPRVHARAGPSRLLQPLLMKCPCAPR